QTPPESLAYLQREEVPYLVAGQQRVDLPQALSKLYNQMGVTSLVSTAGGHLNGALLRAGLVDELYLDLLPALIGGQHTPTLFTAPDLTTDQLPTRMELLAATSRPDGHVLLHYKVSPAPQS
ncbi:MAG: dihydrofolate reductase family protein, partial [Anaerolineales bacterium]|nr:dihydrofolate reductase family protein [Anaerolineales bacterium]